MIMFKIKSFLPETTKPKLRKNGADPKCQFCDKFEETANHLVPGCLIMTINEY